jgi:hypothetical protein
MSPFNFFGPEITDEIRQIAVRRILDGGNLATRKDLDRRTAALVLIVLREMDPSLVLNDDEDALLIGIGVKPLRSLRTTHETYGQRLKWTGQGAQ